MRSEVQVKVLVVDDHVGIRVAIASLVDAEQPRMGCVGTASTVREALARAHDLQPHVVVLDVNLDGEDGLALIPALLRAAPCAVVVLTSLGDARVAAHALRQGAHTCLHKTAPASELIAAIGAAHFAEALPLGLPPANAGGALSHVTGINRP